MVSHEKLFSVVIDGNQPYNDGGIPLSSLRTLLEDKYGREGFNLTRDAIEKALEEANKLELGKIFDLKSIVVKCDSAEFGPGNGSIEIFRAYF